MKKKITLVEVGLRDGLQNEKELISPSIRFKMIKKLSASGLRELEIGSFVSPRMVPQMADTDRLAKKALKLKKSGRIHRSTQFAVLVPNLQGLHQAIDIGLKKIALFTATSDTFTKKNINCTVAESLLRFQPIIKVAHQNKIEVRGYLSTAFGCPYEGKISISKTIRLSQYLFDLGITEVSLGDTIGIANPLQVRALLEKLSLKINLHFVAMHFHDTRGMALANIAESLPFGIRTFDTSLGGLGGCPFAAGASGNVATEDTAYMLESMGYNTGLNLSQLIKTNHWFEKHLNRKLNSKVSQAGLWKFSNLK